MPTVYQRAAVRRDLVEQFIYLAEQAGLDTAERFLSNAEASFNDLARQPMIGASLTLRHPNLVGIRKWHIKNFGNHQIFYLRTLTACRSYACCTRHGTGGAC